MCACDACVGPALLGICRSRSRRYSVPVLWDKKTRSIVNNESSEIIRFFTTAFDEWATGPLAGLDLYPEALRADIDAVNAWVYPSINDGTFLLFFHCICGRGGGVCGHALFCSWYARGGPYSFSTECQRLSHFCCDCRCWLPVRVTSAYCQREFHASCFASIAVSTAINPVTLYGAVPRCLPRTFCPCSPRQACTSAVLRNRCVRGLARWPAFALSGSDPTWFPVHLRPFPCQVAVPLLPRVFPRFRAAASCV